MLLFNQISRIDAYQTVDFRLRGPYGPMRYFLPQTNAPQRKQYPLPRGSPSRAPLQAMHSPGCHVPGSCRNCRTLQNQAACTGKALASIHTAPTRILRQLIFTFSFISISFICCKVIRLTNQDLYTIYGYLYPNHGF